MLQLYLFLCLLLVKAVMVVSRVQPTPPEDSAAVPVGLAAKGAGYEALGAALVFTPRFVAATVLRAVLLPSAFGLMEAVNAVIVGLIMLSDIGLEQAVVHSRRGDDPRFIDTAWTLQVIRGIILWVVACLLAYPAAALVGEDRLLLLIPVAAFAVVAFGFQSTAEFTLRRQLRPGAVVLLEIVISCVTAAVTVVWAMVAPTVWALVAGSLFNALLHLVSSFVLARIAGHINRLRWDQESRKEIISFGKWITASSAVMFLANWSDRLLAVGLLGAAGAGVYATAMLLAEAVVGLQERILQGVLFPLYARVGREFDRRQLRVTYYQSRLYLDGLTLTISGMLAGLAPWIVDILFEAPYAAASWMFRCLSAGAVFMFLASAGETCLRANGLTKYGLYQQGWRTVSVLVGVPAAYLAFGPDAVVPAAALGQLPAVIGVWPALWRLGVLRPEREVLAILFWLAGFGFGISLLTALTANSPS